MSARTRTKRSTGTTAATERGMSMQPLRRSISSLIASHSAKVRA
ncbi:hypothetical protein ACIRST_38510 [Kitasatospora sp. NPDC101447]